MLKPGKNPVISIFSKGGNRVLVLSAFLALTLFGGTCADAQDIITGAAAELSPTTLDDMNTKAQNFTPSKQYTLTTTQGTNTHFLLLDNGSGTPTQYWYTPNEGTLEKNNILNYLTGVALVPTNSETDYVFVTPNGAHYTFDMSKSRPASTYSLSAGTSNSYDIKFEDKYYNFAFKDHSEEIATYTAGISGNHDFQALKITNDGTIHTDKYYNININPTKASSVGSKLSNINWSTSTPSGYSWTNNYVAASNVNVNGNNVTGAIRLKTSHNESVPATGSWNKVFTYTYTKPSTHSFISGNSYSVSTTAAGTSSAFNVPTEGRSANVITNALGSEIATGVASITNKVYAKNVLNGTYSHNYNFIGGSVILNQGTIGDVKADFVGNRTVANGANINGRYTTGAIFNHGTNATISSIKGDFIANIVHAPNFSFGGAICNYNESGTVSIGSIVGDFVGNSVSATVNNSRSQGGAIYNYAKTGTASIGSIVGDFVANSANYQDTRGGAIYNSAVSGTAVIGSITGDFIGNSISSHINHYSYGGAICNDGGWSTAIIESITGNFIGNSATTAAGSSGGAIYNSGIISSIVGDFISNCVNSSSGSSNGGAIYNSKTIGSIVGNFVGNSAYSTYYSSNGGAIYNSSKISSIVGDFIGNSASFPSYQYSYQNSSGGAIYNISTIGSIVGNFISNSASSYNFYTSSYSTSANASSYGGAIYNYNTISSIKGNFVGNSATANSSGNSGSYGGAIYNYGTISSIEGDFVGNYAKAASTSGTANAYGGAIFNGNISSNAPSYYANANITLAGNTFTGNYVDKNGTITPNSIYNAGIINIKDGATVTINDGWQSVTNGQLVMQGSDAVLNMNIGNGKIQADSLGIITNAGTINATVDIDLSDINNPLSDTIAVTSATQNGVINLKSLNFINGSAQDIVDHDLTIQILKYSQSDEKLQLAIDDSIKSSITPKVISTSDAYSVDGITKDVNWNDSYNLIKTTTTVQGILDLATTSTLNDSIGIKVTSVDEITGSSAIDTLKAINQFATTEDRTFTAASADETYAVTDDIGETTSGKLTISGQADGETRSTVDFNSHSGFELNNNDTTLVLKDVELTGANTLVSGNATDNVKIVLDNVVLDGTNGGITTYGDVEIKGNSTISDNITILGGADSNVDIDGTDEVTLDSTMIGAGSKLNIHDGTVNLTNNAQISAFDLTLNDTSLNIANENSLAGLNTTFDGTNNLNIANDSVGVLALGNVNLNGLLKMQVDADLANKQMDQLTATSATVNGGSIEVSKINLLSATTDEKTSLLFTNNSDLANAVSYTGEGTIVYSPIYKYETSYNVKDGQGYFDFVLPSQGGDTPGPVPSDFNPAVLASSVASQAGAMGAMNQGMYYAFEHGDTFMNSPSADRFAQINANSYALSTDYNENREHIDFAHNNKGVWVKPYTVFENIPLKNGPKINAISYGTLIGFDSDFHKMKKGWTNTATAYVGYNGSQLDYTGVDTSTNGGLLGLTETFYKGNFWTAITATAGASVAESHTMYGHDNMTSLMAGIGSKTGYNFEFNEGKFIIQPRLFLSYSFIKTFDYTNAAGVRIDSDPLHTIQINPALKFIGNVKGWQPYASVGMVWNVMDQTKATANGVKLPEMRIKPYVEYGVGVQKHWNEKYSAYLQAMVRNGGRNGIALTGGFRWALGRDSKPVEKVQRVNNKQAKLTSSMPKVKSDKKILNQVKNDKKQVQNAKPQTKSALRIKIDTFFAKMNGEPLL